MSRSMRRLIATIVAIAVFLTLAGCGAPDWVTIYSGPQGVCKTNVNYSYGTTVCYDTSGKEVCTYGLWRGSGHWC